MNIISLLYREAYKLVVVAPNDEYLHYRDEFPEIQHIDLNYLSRKGTNPFQDLRLYFELKNIYKSVNPDLVLHYTVKPNIYGAFAAASQNIPSLAVVTGLGYPFIHKGCLQIIIRFLYRFSLIKHKKVLFENKEDRELFLKYLLIKKHQGISLKGCGVDIEKFSPQKSSANKGTVTFSFIGRLIYDKGIREFAEAAGMIRKKNINSRFLIIGEIDPGNPAAVKEEDLNSWIKNYGVEYLGFQNDVRPYIAKSDCIVLPSYREAIARTLTEAMAMEKPVIAADTAGSKEAIVEGENGWLVPIKDSSALANSFEKFILLSTEEKERMGKSGRQKVLLEFDDKLIAGQIKKIIEKILND